MALATEAQRAASRRATDRARAVLKPGDKIRATGCGGTVATYRFICFGTKTDGTPSDWICSRTRDDIHASHIIRLNGVPTSFRDDPAAHLADPFNSHAGRNL
ncbi:hypothetical protein [Brevundimonas sp.]|uniref:hypothetical protein n=1 Tax=Brevundimonas sp. TaxID=1871086 RepID=UPI00289B941C|nr:hypothetical protein [Brevundimonas sp.]